MVHAEVRENAVMEDHWIAGEKFKRNLLKIQDIQEIIVYLGKKNKITRLYTSTSSLCEFLNKKQYHFQKSDQKGYMAI